MFTAQKSRLFFNDPKFRQVKEWSPDFQQAAVGKIFAGQRQLRRAKVATSTLALHSQTATNDYIMLDFLQSRMNAFEDKMVGDVQEFFIEKERIKDKYSQAEDLYEKSNRKLRRLMSSVKNENVSFDGISDLQNEVMEIQRLYEENQFLKSMNNQIRLRIEKKQGQLGTNRR